MSSEGPFPGPDSNFLVRPPRVDRPWRVLLGWYSESDWRGSSDSSGCGGGGGGGGDDLPSTTFLDFLVKLRTRIGIQMVEEDKATVYPLLSANEESGRCWDLFICFILLMRKLISRHRCY